MSKRLTFTKGLLTFSEESTLASPAYKSLYTFNNGVLVGVTPTTISASSATKKTNMVWRNGFLVDSTFSGSSIPPVPVLAESIPDKINPWDDNTATTIIATGPQTFTDVWSSPGKIYQNGQSGNFIYYMDASGANCVLSKQSFVTGTQFHVETTIPSSRVYYEAITFIPVTEGSGIFFTDEYDGGGIQTGNIVAWDVNWSASSITEKARYAYPIDLVDYSYSFYAYLATSKQSGKLRMVFSFNYYVMPDKNEQGVDFLIYDYDLNEFKLIQGFASAGSHSYDVKVEEYADNGNGVIIYRGESYAPGVGDYIILIDTVNATANYVFFANTSYTTRDFGEFRAVSDISTKSFYYLATSIYPYPAINYMVIFHMMENGSYNIISPFSGYSAGYGLGSNIMQSSASIIVTQNTNESGVSGEWPTGDTIFYDVKADTVLFTFPYDSQEVPMQYAHQLDDVDGGIICRLDCETNRGLAKIVKFSRDGLTKTTILNLSNIGDVNGSTFWLRMIRETIRFQYISNISPLAQKVAVIYPVPTGEKRFDFVLDEQGWYKVPVDHYLRWISGYLEIYSPDEVTGSWAYDVPLDETWTAGENSSLEVTVSFAEDIPGTNPQASIDLYVFYDNNPGRFDRVEIAVAEGGGDYIRSVNLTRPAHRITKLLFTLTGTPEAPSIFGMWAKLRSYILHNVSIS